MTLQDWFKTVKLRMLELGWVDMSTELCYFAFVTNVFTCIWNKSYVRTAGKSLLLLSIVWFSVACYAAVPRLAGLQAYEFVPGYAQCPIGHLSKIGKTINCSIVLILFLTPLITTLFSYTRSRKWSDNTTSMRYRPSVYMRSISVNLFSQLCLRSWFAGSHFGLSLFYGASVSLRWCHETLNYFACFSSIYQTE